MQRTPRNGASIDRLYLHTNEGPQVTNGARNLAGYLERIDAGYHVIVDNENTVRCAADDQIVWGAGGDNVHTLHVCMIGYASQSWTTEYSRDEMERAAQQVAAWAQLHNVPVVHVRPGKPPADRGIAKHADNLSPASCGHTDPGAGFPIDAFVKRVREIIDGPKLLAALGQMVASFVNPIRQGDHGKRVLFVQKLLKARGYDVPLNGIYGWRTVAAVHKFKVRNGWKNTSGKYVGLRCLKRLAARKA